MKKYLLIVFLILTFSLVNFAQSSSKFKIEDFVQVKMSMDKTAIFVGDRVELKLEIVYPRGWGIKILTEDLEKGSIIAVLPDSMILEKAEISPLVSWQDYWLKIEAVYTLFYPEKKHKIGILFNSKDLKSLKIRFKVIDEEDKNPRKGVKIYEVGIKQFVLGARTTLTDSSNEIRDSKKFFGNFLLKSKISLAFGLIFILLGLFIPIKKAVCFIRNKRHVKKISIKRLLKNKYQELQAVCKISNLEEFYDFFCRLLKNLIGLKAGLAKVSSMTIPEIKQALAKEDKQLMKLLEILENYENLRYNPRAKSDIKEKEEALKTVEEILSGWINRERWLTKVKAKFNKVIGVLNKIARKKNK